MLEAIRRNVRHPYIQAILGLLILVFIFFFGWSMRAAKPNYVAKVNGDTIDYRTYQQAYNGLVRLYEDAYKGDLTGDRIRQLGLGRRALDQVIDRVLLTQEADRRGLSVSDQELEAAIQSVPVFQQGGAFSKALYLRVLDANRLTPMEFEASKRQELLLAKVEQAIRAGATVTDAEVEQEFRDRNTKIDLAYVSFEPAAFEAEVKVTPEALQEYYDAEKESFRTPEQREGRYVFFPADEYAGAVEVSEQELRDEFSWRAGEFAVPEAVHARHILFRVAPDATPEQDEAALKKAEKVRSEIVAGADFAKMAEKYSDDPGSKKKGGDLGYFERGAMVPAFEEAAFALEPGTVSEPVKTSFGYHLILVEDHRQAGEPTFEEVKDRIAADVKHRKALEEAYAAADNLLMDLEDAKHTWDNVGEVRPVETTPAVAEGGTLEGVEKPVEFVKLLFSLDPAGPGELFETDKGTYLVSVARTIPSAVPPLEEVKDQVESRYRKAESRRLAEAKAQDLLDAAREKGWAEALKAAGREAQRTGPFTRKGGAVPKIGWSPELKEAAFKLTEAGAVADAPVEAGGQFYTIELAERTEPDMDKLEGEREKLRAELLPAKQTEHFQDYLKELRSQAELEINDELLL